MTGKWQTNRSEPVLSDRWIDVRADHCTTPSGREIHPYYVLRYPDFVNVVAITPDDRLVLVRQYRHGVGEFTLELPAGAVDAGEDPAATARRELAEETGFTSSRWQFVSSLFEVPVRQTNRMHSFLALDVALTEERKLDPGEEGMTVELHPVAEIVSGLSSGMIGSAAHVSALLLGLQAARRFVGAGRSAAPRPRARPARS